MLSLRFARLGLFTAMFAVLLGITTAWAHPKRVAGLVLSVVAEHGHHVAIVRCDPSGSTPALTKRFQLPASVDAATLHEGDRIVAFVDEDNGRALLDDLRVLPAAAPPSALRSVRLLKIGDSLPPTQFVDQTGRRFTFADFRGSSVIAAFIYTRCRDPRECPLISSTFRLLQTRLANGPYHLVEITLDPDYDTPSVLSRYGAQFGADPKRWTLGTGNPATVLDFDARFGIDPFADSRVGLIHTERTVLINQRGKIVDFIDQPGWNPDDVIAQLRADESEPSNILARLDFELSKAAVAICGNRVAGFSGLEDLAIVVVIFGAAAWLLQRVARKIFAGQN